MFTSRSFIASPLLLLLQLHFIFANSFLPSLDSVSVLSKRLSHISAKVFFIFFLCIPQLLFSHFLAGNPLPFLISEQFLTTAFAIATVYTFLAILGPLPSQRALFFPFYLRGKAWRRGGTRPPPPHTKEGEALPAR